jgi:hypothetical protein
MVGAKGTVLISEMQSNLLEMTDKDPIEYGNDHIHDYDAKLMVYCQNLVDKLGFDADEIINMKMVQNEAKYPVDKAKGKSDKYNQL